jgi:hypothetical protein
VSPALMLTDWGLQFDEKEQLAQAERNGLKRLVTIKVRTSILTCSRPNINMCSGHR